MTLSIFRLVAAPSFALLACSTGNPEPQTAANANPPGEVAAASEAALDDNSSSMATPVEAATCDNLLLEDLEDGDARSVKVDGRGGYWFTYKDEVGSTMSPEGAFKSVQGGAEGTASAAHMSGKIAGSGTVYAGMGFSLVDPVGPYDLAKAKGVCFLAKGTGAARVKLPDVNTVPEGGVCKDCFNDFGVDFELTDDWQKHCFEFSAFRQQPGWGEQKPELAVERVYSIQWQLSTPGVDYELWIDNVQLMCD